MTSHRLTFANEADINTFANVILGNVNIITFVILEDIKIML